MITFALRSKQLRMERTQRRSSSLWHTPRAVLPVLFLLALVPARMFFYGCSAEAVPREAVTDDRGAVRTLIKLDFDNTLKKSGGGSSWRFVRSLDIFTFETNGGMHLDSYAHLSNPTYSQVEVFSGNGERRVVMVANSDLSESARYDIFSYDDIKKIVISYCSESSDCPVMTGECTVTAGIKNSISLKPVLALLELQSLSSVPDLKEVSIYLINACESVRPFEDEGSRVMPTEFINQGSFKEKDMQKMAYPRMAYQYLGNGTRYSGKTVFGSGSLYCYPNNAGSESAGSPFTKVIIEGQLDKKTVTYELDINQNGCGYSSGLHGIVRNRRYLFNVEIK